MATTPDYPILGPPRITAAGFADVLRGGGSPAAGEAAACYQAFIAAGVDPAVGLALFRKESTYGLFGRARSNRSWGNIRGGVGYPLDNGNFRIYPTWTLGAQDAARLLTVYGRNQIRPGRTTSTVQTFPFVWAPSSDGNAPDAYGDSLARWIGEWQRKNLPNGPGSFTPPSYTPPEVAATPVASTDQRTNLAAYLGIPPATGVTVDHVKAAADRIATASGAWNRAFPVVFAELKLYLDGHPSINAGDFPIALTAAGAPPRSAAPTGNIFAVSANVAYATGVGGVVRDGLMLAFLLTIVLVGLYMVARS